MGWTLLAATLAMTLTRPASKLPLVLPPDRPAHAWFLEDPQHGRWCAFKDREALEAFSKDVEPVGEGLPGYAYLHLKGERLNSVIVETTSADAFTLDWYVTSDQSPFKELRRTGHYINDAPVTYVYKPDARGRLAPTAATQKLRKSGVTDGFEDYWMEWRTYSRLSDMPFAKLVQFRDGKVSVKAGCTPTPTQPKRGK